MEILGVKRMRKHDSRGTARGAVLLATTLMVIATIPVLAMAGPGSCDGASFSASVAGGYNKATPSGPVNYQRGTVDLVLDGAGALDESIASVDVILADSGGDEILSGAFSGAASGAGYPGWNSAGFVDLQSYNFNVVASATDAVGATCTKSIGPLSFNLDNSAPLTSVDTLSDGSGGTAAVYRFSAFDNLEVASITVTDNALPFAVVSGGSGDVRVDVDGAHSLNYYATDATGNVETLKGPIAVTIAGAGDIIPPVTTSTITSGTAGLNGWYTSNVVVSFASNEAGTTTIYVNKDSCASRTKGLLGTSSLCDGSVLPDVIISGTSSSPVTLSGNGVNNIQYFSTDSAGNQEVPKTLSVKIDKNPPTMASGSSPMTASQKCGGGANCNTRVDNSPGYFCTETVVIYGTPTANNGIGIEEDVVIDETSPDNDKCFNTMFVPNYNTGTAPDASLSRFDPNDPVITAQLIYPIYRLPPSLLGWVVNGPMRVDFGNAPTETGGSGLGAVVCKREDWTGPPAALSVAGLAAGVMTDEEIFAGSIKAGKPSCETSLPGYHILKLVSVADGAGNLVATLPANTVPGFASRVDTAPTTDAVVTGSYDSVNGWFDGDVTVTVTSDDTGPSTLDPTKVQVFIDGVKQIGPIAGLSDHVVFTRTISADGVHTINGALAVNQFGNSGTAASADLTVLIEQNGPIVVPLLSGPKGDAANADPFGFNGPVDVDGIEASDAGSGVNAATVKACVYADGSPACPPASPFVPETVSAAGKYFLKYEASDNAGNPSNGETPFYIDIVAPAQALITSPIVATRGPPLNENSAPGFGVVCGTVDIGGQAYDVAGADLFKVIITIDGGLLAAFNGPQMDGLGNTPTAPWDSSGATVGSHEIGLTAFDIAGNSKSDFVTVYKEPAEACPGG